MSSFSQYWSSYQKSGTVKQFTWVCGTERVLVEEIVQTVRQTINPSPWNFSQFVVGEDSERAIWADMGQYPIDSGRRLLIIRNAEALKSFDPLVEFIAHRTLNPRTYVLLVSGEERLTRVPSGEDGKFQYAPHLAAFGAKGNIVECRPFTQDTAKHAVAWVVSKTGMREGVAGHLLERANGDLRLVRDTCEKLSVLDSQLSLGVINSMLAERPRDTFSNSLMALDKKTALLALSRLPESEYSRTLGLLESRLDLAHMVHTMLIQQKSASEIGRAAGEKRFLVPDLLPIGKHYDAARCQAIRRALATADEALRAGARQGVLEVVVSLW